MSRIPVNPSKSIPVGKVVYLRKGIHAKTKEDGHQIYLPCGSQGYLVTSLLDYEFVFVSGQSIANLYVVIDWMKVADYVEYDPSPSIYSALIWKQNEYLRVSENWQNYKTYIE